MMKSDSWNVLCDSCQKQPCCTDYTSPLVFPHEYEEIKNSLIDLIDFANPISINDVPMYELRKKDNSNDCIFWNNSACSVYEHRPFDCRLFPFDIYKINGKYTWVVYSCNPDSDWTWSENILQTLEAEASFIKSVKYLEEFSDLGRLEHDKNDDSYKFQILREVNLNRNTEKMENFEV